VNDTPQVVDDPAASRFMIEADGRVAELVYQLEDGDRLLLIHTGVPRALEGRGFGSMLVAAAIDEARRRGLTVVPLCPFARDWLARHPEVAATVPVDGSA
jgi:predicted GNAT family acetyltransferase